MQTITISEDVALDFRTSEAYKTLRTNISLCGNDIKVISVTSCTPNEGKSSVSFNLARSMAQAGNKVILLDGDLRKSVLVGRYKAGKMTRGFTHYLSGQAPFEDVVCKTNIPNLHVVFAGPTPPNPSELLGKTHFKLLISSLKKIYEYIIIDCPPLGSVIDGAIIARESDGAILVIESGKISYKFAQKVKEQLTKTGCMLLGVVLNKVNMTGKGYYGKYYGNYYGKYYGKDYVNEYANESEESEELK